MVNTYSDLPNWIVNYFEPTLFWINVGLCIIVAFIFYRNYKKTEVGKKFALGLFAFAACFTVARALENYRKFYLADSRLNIVRGWVGEIPRIGGTELYIRISYYIFCWISIAIFFYNTEKYVFQGKTKYTFMVGSIIEGSASIMLYFTAGITQEYVQHVATVFFFVCAVAPIILYFNMARKSTGILKKSAYLAALGLTFFVLGVLAELPESQFVTYMVTGEFLDAYLIAVFSPISMMIGFILLVIGYKQMFSSIF